MNKKTKRNYKFEWISLMTFSIAFLAYLCSSIMLHSVNNSLSIEIQSMKSTIASYETENKSLSLEIQTLSTKDRVMDIANEAGLSLNQENIITIYSGDE